MSSTIGGTVLLTGANGSLGVYMVDYLLQQYPNLTLVLTVRDDSDHDSSTLELRGILSKHTNATAIMRKLDLSALEEVAAFSSNLQAEINNGKIPRLKAIICNAMSWKMSGGPAYSKDGYEMAIAVNHLAHFSLSLRLLASLDAKHGRIVFLGSEAHWPLRAGLSKGFPTHVPDDLELLVHPQPDDKSQEMGRGFQRYGTSKLVITMVMYELSRRLKQASRRLCEQTYPSTDAYAGKGHWIHSRYHSGPDGADRLQNLPTRSYTQVVTDRCDRGNLPPSCAQVGHAILSICSRSRKASCGYSGRRRICRARRLL